MQINAHNNLPIIAGYDRPQQQKKAAIGSEEENKRSADRNTTALEGQIIQAQYGSTYSGTQRVRPTVDAQPLFNQQLTQSGEQAQRAYQDIALTGDVELANRLDVVV